MASTFPTTSGFWQGDQDANNFGLLNFNKASLGLVKADVGLGNVDNTSDLNKPVGTATTAALALKQNLITLGTTAQFFRGDLSLATYGALALQNGDTTLEGLSSRGTGGDQLSYVAARRNDWASSFADTALIHYGASYAGVVLTGVNRANAGVLSFQNATVGVIKTNNSAPIIFGTNTLRRMRLTQGLAIGADTDPGHGCLLVSDTITADHFEGDDLVLTGDITSSGGASFGGGNVTIEAAGDIETGGEVVAALGFTTPSTITGGGNMAVVGSIISFSGLPTSDPGSPGRLWRDGANVKISI